MSLCVVFHDTATTEIYTYGHTLSLRDALPIWKASKMLCCWSAAMPIPESCTVNAMPAPGWPTTDRQTVPCSVNFTALDSRRSEEHTSELQSLMRISYAVFCLQKKKTIDRYRQHLITT